MATQAILSHDDIDTFQRDGVVLIKGLFKDWVEPLRAGIDHNMQSPGEFGKNYTKDGQSGHFFGDYCNWQRIPQYHDFFFSSYYCVNGKKVCSLWIPLDPVDQSVCPEFIAGSHQWGKWFVPTKFSGDSYVRDGDKMVPIPDIDADRSNYDIKSWQLEPGDCIAFHFLTVHGAPENLSAHRRRAFSARLLGDDATFVIRGGEMSPPFPGLDKRLDVGAPMDADEFPVIYS